MSTVKTSTVIGWGYAVNHKLCASFGVPEEETKTRDVAWCALVGLVY